MIRNTQHVCTPKPLRDGGERNEHEEREEAGVTVVEAGLLTGVPGDPAGEDMVILFTMESISRSYLLRQRREQDCERFSKTKVLSAAAAVAGEMCKP